MQFFQDDQDSLANSSFGSRRPEMEVDKATRDHYELRLKWLIRKAVLISLLASLCFASTLYFFVNQQAPQSAFGPMVCIIGSLLVKVFYLGIEAYCLIKSIEYKETKKVEVFRFLSELMERFGQITSLAIGLYIVLTDQWRYWVIILPLAISVLFNSVIYLIAIRGKDECETFMNVVSLFCF